MSATRSADRSGSTAVKAAGSPTAKLVCLYLRTTGAATTAQLQEALGLRKLTLFSVLSTLEDRDLVERDESGQVTLHASRQ
ncbi:MarR family transcriptional regulator [Haloarchaeobius amylolyticus]|uniref:MarR family transcriptional regulator n=1 Tax=Haloarchaeobius amylolyticus TaxID=1198296 RepID=UPI00226FB4A4|nr:MarR family transcriptional regulator [Haloarchaeobius amylolyticus]